MIQFWHAVGVWTTIAVWKLAFADQQMRGKNGGGKDLRIDPQPSSVEF